MSEEAKIHLSAFETELVNNTEWIFTKQLIIEKIYHFFGHLQDRYKNLLEDNKGIPQQLLQKQRAKISRGENYNGLPYIILDYPATFSKENIFAIRTMFWWGNFFSISLHLSGESLHSNKETDKWLPFLREKNFYVCINEKEWEHDFSSLNYIRANNLNAKQIAEISSRSFFKTGKNIALYNWDSVPSFLENAFAEIIEFVKFSFPGDEITL
jgi:hypothetical protein